MEPPSGQVGGISSSIEMMVSSEGGGRVKVNSTKEMVGSKVIRLGGREYQRSWCLDKINIKQKSLKQSLSANLYRTGMPWTSVREMLIDYLGRRRKSDREEKEGARSSTTD